jgi:hypothetical protein
VEGQAGPRQAACGRLRGVARRRFWAASCLGAFPARRRAPYRRAGAELLGRLLTPRLSDLFE